MGNICCGGSKEEKKASALEGDSVTDMGSHHDATTAGTTASGYSHGTSHYNAGGSGGPIGSNSHAEDGSILSGGYHHPDQGGAHGSSGSASNAFDLEKQQRMLQEQARLEQIVQTIGRGMVSVRSTRGSTGYYDQGFAAALSQLLEQTTRFTSVPIRLPEAYRGSEGDDTTTTTTSNNKNSAKLRSNLAGSSAPSSGGVVDGSKITTATASSPSRPNNATTQASTSLSSSTSATAASASGTTTATPITKPQSGNSVYARLSQPQWDGIALGLKGEGLAGCAGENPNTFLDHIAESYLDAVLPKKERLFAGANPIVENLL